LGRVKVTNLHWLGRLSGKTSYSYCIIAHKKPRIIENKFRKATFRVSVPKNESENSTMKSKAKLNMNTSVNSTTVLQR
jgi:hypothetical protein